MKEFKVGQWLVKKDPIYRSTSQGRITKIDGNIAFYFNQDAFDGFGATFEADLDSLFVTVS